MWSAACALVKGFMDGKGVDLVKMLTRSWGMRCFELVESYSQHFKIFYCCQRWDCFANSSKYVNDLIFLVATDLTTTAKIHFKLAPNNVTFSASKTWQWLSKSEGECFDQHFWSTPVWCVPSCPCHREHLYDQSLMACVGDPPGPHTCNRRQPPKSTKL